MTIDRTRRYGNLLRPGPVVVLTVVAIGVFGYLGRHVVTRTTVNDGQPVLHVPELRHDFGILVSDQPRQHTFVVHNRGSRRVVLNPESCGCASDQSLPRQILLPAGAETDLTVYLNPQNRFGPITQTLTVATSDPQRPELHFTVTATVERTLASTMETP